MKQYLELCQLVLEKGKLKEDRTGTGTISHFGHQMRFDLTEGFPLMTTKKLNVHLIISELLWFIKGETNIEYLLKENNNIWNEWAFKRWVESPDYDGPDMTDFGVRYQKDEAFRKVYKEQMKRFKQLILTDPEFAKKYGDLGPIYGKQWRSWAGADGRTYDQLKWVIEEIKRNPNSRQLVVSAWNPEYIIKDTEGKRNPNPMALPPCHVMFQFYVEGGRLSCQLYQRSADIFLGLPFNIASYAFLVHMVAQVTGLKVGEFIHVIGDAHIYLNHIEQVKLQLTRKPYPLPNLQLNPQVQSIDDFRLEDFTILHYQAHPHIKGDVSV